MTESAAWLRRRAADLRIAVAFATRLPVGAAQPVASSDIARMNWALPVAGALVGALGALVYWLAYRLGLAPMLCAVLAVGTTLVVTGCLHEDGLADTADGFGGGATRERKLAIMRDSRTGTFGACALVLSILLRTSALAVLAEPAAVVPALIAAHVAARATLPVFMRMVPPARADGLSAVAGTPVLADAVAAGLIGAAALLSAFTPAIAVPAVVLLVAAVAGMSRLSMQQIGGQTGDVNGALEQVGEMLVLVIATAA
jgi:adenosylcobinamide-GDP ribazoletransferase